MRASLWLLVCLLASGAAAGTGSSDPGRSRQFVIGLSPYLDRSVKDEVYRSIVKLMVEGLPLNSTLSIYDAFALKSITEVVVPADRAFESAKTRANQFAVPIRELKQFLAADHPRPAAQRLRFDASLRLPQFLDFLVENGRLGAARAGLLLMGSPLYEDAQEPAFSMVNGFFPSDGHLQASRDQTVFGADARRAAAVPLLVHWIFFGDPWLNELHKEKVLRFWSLYLEHRGNSLAACSADPRTALAGFLLGWDNTTASPRHWQLDPAQTKIEMLRVGRDVSLTDWITRDASPVKDPRPPSAMAGPMKIGIRWKEPIDLDLYSVPRPGAETLFFLHPRSPEGYYYKDHRSSPGREFEFIEFEHPVDIRQVEAFVNFYEGSCPSGPRGEARIEYEGRIFAAPFSLAAEEGNRGRAGARERQCWTRIPVQEILNLEPGATGAQAALESDQLPRRRLNPDSPLHRQQN